MSDSERYLFSIVDEIQTKEGQHGFDGLDQKEQVFIAVWSLEAEVNNGGFHQYFDNTAGDTWQAAVIALQKIGATHTAGLLQSAAEVFGPRGPNSERGVRQREVEALSKPSRERLDAFDRRFFEYKESLSELLTTFMKQSAG
jgi:Domain of unknown function (DUF4375)